MTVKDFISNLDIKILSLKEDNKPFEVGIYTVISQMIPRIFEDGMATNGSKIGSYNNTKPIYVNTSINSPVKDAPRGKDGKDTFKNGKKKKTTYYQSYKEFRQKQGRESGFVNIDLTGELKLDIAKGESSIDINKFKINSNEYRITVTKEINSKKVKGLEKKYGQVFMPTNGEIEKMVEVIDFELKKYLND